jgi:hypothetical protein
MGWFVLGLLLGYGMGWNRKADNIPKDLETCDSERSRLHADIVYYKRLTKNLVDENQQLRKQINDA